MRYAMENANTQNKGGFKATVAMLVTVPGFLHIARYAFRECHIGLKQGT